MAAEVKGATANKKARLAEELRANLARRKAQTRARRAGEADLRDDGIGVAARPEAATERPDGAE